MNVTVLTQKSRENQSLQQNCVQKFRLLHWLEVFSAPLVGGAVPVDLRGAVDVRGAVGVPGSVSIDDFYKMV